MEIFEVKCQMEDHIGQCKHLIALIMEQTRSKKWHKARFPMRNQGGMMTTRPENEVHT